jgi:hypothetical protein
MRPLLCAVLLIASGVVVGIAAPSGRATAAVPGDGCLVVRSGFGNVTISLSRGVVFGRVQSISTITTDDTALGDGPPPQVYGAGSQKVLPDGRIRYTGNQVGTPIRFRSTGAVRIRITDATLLDLSVVGKGVAVLYAGTFNPPGENTYSADAASFCEDNFLAVPVAPARPVKVAISSPES